MFLLLHQPHSPLGGGGGVMKSRFENSRTRHSRIDSYRKLDFKPSLEGVWTLITKSPPATAMTQKFCFCFKLTMRSQYLVVLKHCPTQQWRTQGVTKDPNFGFSSHLVHYAEQLRLFSPSMYFERSHIGIELTTSQPCSNLLTTSIASRLKLYF